MGATDLARNIMWRALADWARLCRVGHCPSWPTRDWYGLLGFASETEELEVFFRSGWCEELANVAGGDGGYLAYLQQVQEIRDCGGAWDKRRSWKLG